MEIARAWGKDPDWFYSLEKSTQIQLWAWWRIHNDPQGKYLKKRKRKDSSSPFADIKAAQEEELDDAPARHIAPRPKIVARKGGAPHVKRK